MKIIDMARYCMVTFCVSFGVITTATKSCEELHKPKGAFVTKSNEYAIEYEGKNRSVGATVKAVCHDRHLVINGSAVRTCLSNGTWSGTEPNCIPPPPTTAPPPTAPPIRVDIIIGGTLGGVIVVLVLPALIIALIKCMKRRQLRQGRQKAALLEDGQSRRLFKVWTCRRGHKGFVWADTLQTLTMEAARIFDRPKELRVVLEVDGTEVMSDSILNACTDKTLMVLAPGEIWWSEKLVSCDGNKIRKRQTFDVCSKDRKIRKLFLAESLLDLFEQAVLFFDYRPTRACIEEDGTIIEDTDSLFASAKNTIMLLASEDSWTQRGERTSAGILQDVIIESETGDVTGNMRLFKVWSEDKMSKLAVFADNIAGLHIAAAKIHGLTNPIEICVLRTGERITSDTQLDQNEHEVLFVRKPVTVYQPPADDSLPASSAYQYIDDNDILPNKDDIYSKPNKNKKSPSAGESFVYSHKHHPEKTSNYTPEVVSESEITRMKRTFPNKQAEVIPNVSIERDQQFSNGAFSYQSEGELNISNGRQKITKGVLPKTKDESTKHITPNWRTSQSNMIDSSLKHKFKNKASKEKERNTDTEDTIPLTPLPVDYSLQKPGSPNRTPYEVISDSQRQIKVGNNFDFMRKKNESYTSEPPVPWGSRGRSMLITGGEVRSSHYDSDVLF